MDERMKELVAMGASAAANCKSCLEHHLAECNRLGIDRKDVAAAVEVGIAVNRGAAAATRRNAEAILGGLAEPKPAGGGCGCGS